MSIVDEHAVDRTRFREPGGCARCGRARQAESDPSAMLGLVMLVIANTLVVLALGAAIAWLVV